jgi:hypothetical protein
MNEPLNKQANSLEEEENIQLKQYFDSDIGALFIGRRSRLLGFLQSVNCITVQTNKFYSYITYKISFFLLEQQQEHIVYKTFESTYNTPGFKRLKSYFHSTWYYFDGSKKKKEKKIGTKYNEILEKRKELEATNKT